ncbi:MAG: hypothetical protein V8R90_08890 [Eubacterium sp.]
MEQNKETATQNKQREAEICAREETDRMGQMERGHTAEVKPDCMTEVYTIKNVNNTLSETMQRY